MTTIDARCNSCGWQAVKVADVFVFVCEDDATLTTFSFDCPACKAVQGHLADVKTVEMLGTAGALVRTWRKVPLPLPPLTLDDLIDFHASLDAELDSLLEDAA